MDAQAMSSVEPQRTTDAPQDDRGEHSDVEEIHHTRARRSLLKSVPTASW